MKNLILIIFLFNFCLPINGQPQDNSNTDPNLALADDLFTAKDYYNALQKYLAYYETNKDLAVAAKIAMINEQLRDYGQAERWYGGVVAEQSAQGSYHILPEAQYKYGQVLKMNGKYADAKVAFKSYMSAGNDEVLLEQSLREIEGCEMATTTPMSPDMSFKNMGNKVNTKYSEYSPVMVSENELYFTAIRANKLLVKEYAKDDFYSKAYSVKRENGKWSTPKLLTSNINAPDYHIGNLCLSEDGNTMYFTRAVVINSNVVESKLYFSKKQENGWGSAQLAEGLNGNYLVRQPAVGELYGQKVIFFVTEMNREGHSDIYYSTIRADGFAPPRNLGAVINTNGNEETPFFTNGTLYFSSNGHVGFGGFDIFSSSWDGANWSEPTNMGGGYNSSLDDLYFSTNHAGDAGFLVSNRSGSLSLHSPTCCNDIWAFSKEKKEVQVIANTFEAGKILLKGAEVTIMRVERRPPSVDVKPMNGATVSLGDTESVNKNEKTSSVSFAAIEGDEYVVVAQKHGYISDTLSVKLSDYPDARIIELELFLTELEPEYETYTINEPIELRNIFYEYDRWAITKSSEEHLEVLRDLMLKYPDMVIELAAHTDSRGEADYNLDLSQKRANSVRNWLGREGVDKKRIKAIGYGETQIRNHCVDGVECKDEEHRENRRTEFKIISGPSSIQVEKIRLKGKG